MDFSDYPATIHIGPPVSIAKKMERAFDIIKKGHDEQSKSLQVIFISKISYFRLLKKKAKYGIL